MKKLRFKIVQLVAMVGLLIAGIGVSVALASNGNGPPSSPPGQGECEHGNSGQECKPDPQPEHGQECDEHGPNEGGVNEDHCLSTTTTTTPSTSTTTTTPSTSTTTTTPSTSTTTTTTPCTEAHPCGGDCEEDHGPLDCTTSTTTTTTPETTTTTPTTPGCGVGAGKDGKPGNDDCATSTTTTPTPSTSTTTPSTSSTTTTTTVLGTTTTESSGGVAPAASSSKPKQGVKGEVASATAGELPFTGFPAWILAIAGSMLLLSGLGMRRFAKQDSAE